MAVLVIRCMRNLLLIITLFVISVKAFTQNKTDIGFRLGATYYVGDFNESIPFSSPNFGGGGLLKYNFNDYYAARIGVNGGYYSGAYSLSKGYLPNGGGAFSSLVVDGSAALEINFLPFNALAYKRDRITPFVSFGVGASYASGLIIPVIPMSIGCKYRPVSRVTVGAEWILTKTFSDRLDGYVNLVDQKKSVIHNNDWYSVAGLFITFRLLNNRTTCPVYK